MMRAINKNKWVTWNMDADHASSSSFLSPASSSSSSYFSSRPLQLATGTISTNSCQITLQSSLPNRMLMKSVSKYVRHNHRAFVGNFSWKFTYPNKNFCYSIKLFHKNQFPQSEQTLLLLFQWECPFPFTDISPPFYIGSYNTSSNNNSYNITFACLKRNAFTKFHILLAAVGRSNCVIILGHLTFNLIIWNVAMWAYWAISNVLYENVTQFECVSVLYV